MCIYIYILIDILWINQICLYNMNHYDLYHIIYLSDWWFQAFYFP